MKFKLGIGINFKPSKKEKESSFKILLKPNHRRYSLFERNNGKLIQKEKRKVNTK